MEGGAWVQHAKLLSSTPVGDPFFGARGYNNSSTLLSDDGNTAFISGTTGTNRGNVHIFTRSGTVWTEQQVLISPTDQGTDFGCSMTIDKQGVLYISDLSDATSGNSSGAVFIWVFSVFHYIRVCDCRSHKP